MFYILHDYKICKRGMTVNTEIGNAVNAADKEAQYDERAKRLLSNKIILAHILVKTIDEFYGMDPEEVQNYIEGEPIVFYVRMKDGVSQIIVNLEAQKDEPARYDILNRAIFYVSRLVSSQKERDFAGTNYNDIKRVFSIWLCMNMKENSMSYIHLKKDDLLGSYSWKGRLDLLNIVMIGLADKLPEYNKKYELHRLLGTLLSMELTVMEKFQIMKNEYNISMDDKIREDVGEMCNLSQGILEMGEARGEARGRAEEEMRFILRMYEKGYTLEQIADVMEKSLDEIKIKIENSGPIGA